MGPESIEGQWARLPSPILTRMCKSSHCDIYHRHGQSRLRDGSVAEFGFVFWGRGFKISGQNRRSEKYEPAAPASGYLIVAAASCVIEGNQFLQANE